MTDARRARLILLARLIIGFTILGVAVGAWLATIDQQPTDMGLVLAFGLFPIVGYLMATRRPDNSLSWLMLGIGAAIGLGALLGSYAGYGLHGGIGGRELGLIAESLNNPMWVPVVGLPVTFLLLLFPDGHLPSPRWRWFARILGASLAIVFLTVVLAPGKFGADAGVFANYQNPLGLERLRPVFTVAIFSLAMLPIGVIGSLVALVQRFRRSSGIERLQLRWLVTAATIVAVLYTVALLIGFVGSWSANDQPGWMTVFRTVAVFSFGSDPDRDRRVGVALPPVRHRRRHQPRAALGALAVFITVVYVGIVVGVGAIVGSRADPILSAAAAAIVALAFQPARRRAQRFADRLVYGERAAPYEVLSEFSERLGNAYANEDLLPRMARALAGAPGRPRRRVGPHRETSSSPRGGGRRTPRRRRRSPATDDDVSDASAIEMREPIRHQGELLGALSIVKRPGESITPTEDKLVRDLAAQAGLVMRNVALTEQLMDHIEQLRASRQRLVHAQDEERRKLERNLHDGAQQQLVALSVRLRLAEGLVDRDSEKTKAMLADLQTDRRGRRSRISATSREASTRRSSRTRGSSRPWRRRRARGRSPRRSRRRTSRGTRTRWRRPSTSARSRRSTTWRSTQERAAPRCGWRRTNGDLTFEVSDDGAGFDSARTSYGTGLRGMSDRVEAIGGVLEIRSAPGEGTSVTGRIPAVAVPTEREPS